MSDYFTNLQKALQTYRDQQKRETERMERQDNPVRYGMERAKREVDRFLFRFRLI